MSFAFTGASSDSCGGLGSVKRQRLHAGPAGNVPSQASAPTDLAKPRHAGPFIARLAQMGIALEARPGAMPGNARDVRDIPAHFE